MAANINFQELANRLRSPTRSSLHLILDVNGFMVERAHVSKLNFKAARALRAPWRTFQTHKRSIWLRPHLSTFLKVCLRKHNVAVWTSAEERNSKPLLDAISNEYQMQPSLTNALQFVWYRSHCQPDIETGKFASIKSLADVWQNQLEAAAFNLDNSILVDDTPTKGRLFPSSLIVVPEYCALLMGTRYNTDDTLLWLLIYFEYIAQLAQKHGRVPEALKEAISFSRFCEMGKAEATLRRNGSDRHKSLAFVFVGDANGLQSIATTSELVALK